MIKTQHLRHNATLKWARDISIRFTEEDIKMANRQVERYSVSGALRKYKLRIQ